MRPLRFSLALFGLLVPLSLAGCDSGDGGDAVLDGESGDMEGDASDESGADSEEQEPEGCDGTSPYMGGWDIGCCQDEVFPSPWSPGGVYVGSIIPDWIVTDQHGDAVRLYDFCHDAIYFEYASVW